MSDVAKQMIICPHCHRTAYFNIWNSINTKTDPETYGQVRRLSLFRFCCPYCRQKERALENALAHYKYRIVRTHEEFLEKLAIFDAGLDDRIVELAKVIVGAEAERQLSETGFRVKSAFFSFSKEKNEKKLVFRDKNSSQTATVSFDRYVTNVYNRLVDRYRAALEGPHKKDTVINRNWAADILKTETAL